MSSHDTSHSSTATKALTQACDVYRTGVCNLRPPWKCQFSTVFGREMLIEPGLVRFKELRSGWQKDGGITLKSLKCTMCNIMHIICALHANILTKLICLQAFAVIVNGK